MICTVDTDVVVILIGKLHNNYPNGWPLEQGNISATTASTLFVLQKDPVASFLFMHSQDVIPHLHFFGRIKKTAWATWNVYPEINGAFVFILETNSYTQVAPFFPFPGEIHCSTL